MAEAHTPQALEKLRALLKAPLAANDSLSRTLELTSFARVVRRMPFVERRKVAVDYARAATSRPARIGSPDAIATLVSRESREETERERAERESREERAETERENFVVFD